MQEQCGHTGPRHGAKTPPDITSGGVLHFAFTILNLPYCSFIALASAIAFSWAMGGPVVGSKSIPLRFRLTAKTVLHSFAPPLSHHSRFASAAGTLRIAPYEKFPGLSSGEF